MLQNAGSNKLGGGVHFFLFCAAGIQKPRIYSIFFGISRQALPNGAVENCVLAVTNEGAIRACEEVIFAAETVICFHWEVTFATETAICFCLEIIFALKTAICLCLEFTFATETVICFRLEVIFAAGTVICLRLEVSFAEETIIRLRLEVNFAGESLICPLCEGG